MTEADPLDYQCHRCYARAGQPCRDYTGRRKMTCKGRGPLVPAPGPIPRQLTIEGYLKRLQAERRRRRPPLDDPLPPDPALP
jgi:hypothetical protein